MPRPSLPFFVFAHLGYNALDLFSSPFGKPMAVTLVVVEVEVEKMSVCATPFHATQSRLKKHAPHSVSAKSAIANLTALTVR